MPEGPEVDTETLNETIHDAVEKGGSFLKRVALTTAVLAAFAAVASLRAGATINEALLLKTEATRFQAEASDQWAYYQAKGIKAAVEEAARTAWLAADKAAPAALEETVQRYAHEQQDIQHDAREKERERDAKSKEADQLLAHHHGFANSVALFQIAIALGAVSALTQGRALWVGSMLLGAAAIVLFAIQFV
jgi:hypothetical protein